MILIIFSLQLDENGLPDIDKIKSVISRQFKEDAWQQKVINDVIDECMAVVAAKIILEPQLQKSTSNSTIIPKCNPGPSIMAYCMWKQLLIRCPVELQDKTPQCQRIREKAQKVK